MRFSTRILTSLGLAAIVAAAAPAASGASAPTLTLTATWVAPGGGLGTSGSGFKAGKTVTISLDATPLASVTASATGTFTKAIVIPTATLPGTHTLSAAQPANGLSARKPVAVGANWSQYRFGPARWGANPLENVLTTSNASQLTLNWQTPALLNPTFQGSPSEAEGHVFQICGRSDAAVCAYAQSTGTLLWKSVSLPRSGAAGTPSVSHGVVIVGSPSCYTQNGYCQALSGLSEKTGALLWTRGIPESPDWQPLITGSTFYYDTDYELFAASVSTGRTIWSRTLSLGAATAPADGANEMVIANLSSWSLEAHSPVDGHRLWTSPAAPFALTYTPTIGGGEVFAGGLAGGAAGFGAWNATTGAPIWSNTNVFPQTPGCYGNNGIVYVGTAGGLVAFNVTDGTVLWTASPGVNVQGAPVVANGVVYYGAGSTLVAANATTGATLWSHAETTAVRWSLMVVNGRVFDATGDGAFHAYHL